MTNPHTARLVEELRIDIATSLRAAHSHKAKQDNEHRYWAGMAEGIQRALDILGHTAPSPAPQYGPDTSGIVER